MWELSDGNVVRYRCRVGHAYSEQAMVEAQASTVETALWAALKVLEERGELMRRIASRLHDQPRTEHRFKREASEAEDRAAVIRRVLSTGSANAGLSPYEPEESAAG